MAKAKPKRNTRRKVSLADRIYETLKVMTAEWLAWSYGVRFVSVDTVAEHLAVDDLDQMDGTIQDLVDRGRLLTGGKPVHSIALVYGRGGHYPSVWLRARTSPNDDRRRPSSVDLKAMHARLWTILVIENMTRLSI